MSVGPALRAARQRWHARLINLLGGEKVIVSVDKVDNASRSPYSQARFDYNDAEDILKT